LNGQKYVQFLTSLLEDVPLYVWQTLLYKHNRCPAH
jgi:hypothetical protein